MKPTIQDIAKHANVSVTTVSQILNNKGSRFSEATRAKVKAYAKEINYRPNRLAAGLKTRQTKTIGLIIPDIRNPFFSSLAKGVDERAAELGWSVMLSNSSDSHQREVQLIAVMHANQVDGILFCMAGNTDEVAFNNSYKELAKASTPFLLLDRFFPIPNMDDILTLDHAHGGYLATKHLIELGHDRIACITGPLHLIDAKERLNGYRKALRESNIQYDESIVFEGNYHPDTGYAHASDLLSRNHNVTAFFCCNDLMAFGAINAIEERGFSIPEDFSIVGYDDVVFDYMKSTTLTSIYQPVLNLGKLAAEKIIQRIGVSVEMDEISLEPELRIRSTSKQRQ